VLLPVRAVGVMGDGRTYDCLRASGRDLDRRHDRRLLPVRPRVPGPGLDPHRQCGINRVVTDITSKPPGTIEWE